MKARTIKEKLQLFLMTVPATIVYTFFLIIPIGMAIYFSFHNWNGIKGSPLTYVGLRNFIKMFKNRAFRISIINLIKLVSLSVLFHTPIALLLAVAINNKYKGNRIFKSIFFVPTIFPLTAIGLLWYFVFMPSGALNNVLGVLGLDNLIKGWLIDPSTAMYTIIFVNIWAGIGYYMVILLAGLKDIPKEIYDAAEIDGASSINIFFQITIPILKPIIGMCILLDIIGTIKVFDLVFVMTGGGPNGLTNLPTTLMYYEAFRYDNYGIGSAIGVIILIIALVLTIGSEYIMRDRGIEE
ncbi:carbohydrate ABC transporter permease [Tissierellaceae bacterium HCP3S3_D8]